MDSTGYSYKDTGSVRRGPLRETAGSSKPGQSNLQTGSRFYPEDDGRSSNARTAVRGKSSDHRDGAQGEFARTTKQGFGPKSGQWKKSNTGNNLPPAMIHYKNNIMKTKAHQIAHDSESLREDILVYKNKLKTIKKDNLELKMMHDKLERKNLEYENFIQNNEYFWTKSDRQESKLLTSLKKQERTLQEKLQQKQQEHDDAVRSVRYTKLREMEIEIEELEDENKRLSAILAQILQSPQSNETALSEMEQKYYKKRNLIAFLRRDNEDMEETLKILADQNKKYQEEIQNNEREILECEDKLGDIRKDIKKKDTQIQMLRKEDHDPHIKEQERRLRQELDRVRDNKKHLESDIRAREDEIAKLQDRIQEERLKHERAMEQDRNEKNKLKMEIEEVKRKLNKGYRGDMSEQNLSEEESQDDHQDDGDRLHEEIEPENSIPKTLNAQNSINQRMAAEERLRIEEEQAALHSQEEARAQQERKQQEREQKELIALNKAEETLERERKEEERRREEERKKRETSAKVEMELQKKKESIGRELRYIVRAKKLDQKQLEAALIDMKQLYENKVTLDYVRLRLESEPFQMYDKARVELVLACIEEESGSNKSSYSPQEVIQPIKDLIGPYKIESEAEERARIQSLNERYFIKDRNLLESSLLKGAEFPQAKDGLCTEDQLKKFFLSRNIVMSKDDHEFVVLLLFRESGRLDMLQYKKLLQIFKGESNTGMQSVDSKGSKNKAPAMTDFDDEF